jgi:ABC-2 type transport system permease protein
LRLLDRQKIQKEKLFWQTLNLGLPLLLIIIAGLIYNFIRKKKYT